MCKVVISGFYGFDNAGDEAILQSMISEFRKANSNIEIVVLSANPIKTARDYNVHAVNRSNMAQIYLAVKNCDMLISGGGSLLQDATSVLSMWYYSSIILLAFMLKKPVFAFAQGIGPIVNKFNIRLLRYIMNRVFSISVRDKRSLGELKNLGVSRNVSCTIDPAFLIEMASKDESLKILQSEAGGRSLERPKIGFSIRRWKGDVDVSGIIAQVADRVYRELGAEVVLFPLHYEKDIQLAEEIAQQMQEQPIIVRGNYASAQLLSLYGLMDINVCVRFHGLVFSIMNNIPMVAISYDPKIDSLMEALEMENILRYENIDVDAVFHSIQEKWKDREQISVQISSKIEEFRILARQGICEVTQFIKTFKKDI